MSKYCSSCGHEIEEKTKYCTECGVMHSDSSSYTYSNRTFKEPSLYNYKGHSDTGVNVKYSKLVKNINASFAIGVGVLIAFVALLVWISL
ncbi:MAG: zinc ribbon domain-containing protein [Clostridia bacterium]|nr:zinc ribbon domain-containing protein [Clostridia bacterium]